jgi:hypothetical protein
MTDEQFDQDLRSVLLEGAPREVSDDLRRRVAAVPMTHPVPSVMARPVWRHPVPLAIAALAAVAIVLAVGFWRFGPAGPTGVGVGPSSAPASVADSPSPPATVQPTGGTACVATDLAGRILGWQGAAGSRIADVAISNTAARRCVVRGTPGLQLVDADGRILIDSATAGPSGQPHVVATDPTFELAPGAQVRTEVRASNYCGPAPVSPIDVAFTLPSAGGRVVATPAPGVSSAEAVPPCLGSSGSLIEMNGWRR